MHDHSTVLAIDLSIFSMGAIHSGLPVSFRSRIAFRRRRTGWYVSGTNRTIRQSYRSSVSVWCTWCAAQPYLNSRPDDEHVETPVLMSTHRQKLPARPALGALDTNVQDRCDQPKQHHRVCRCSATRWRRWGRWVSNKHLPSPRSVLNDETSYQRANFWTDEWTGCVNHHRRR
jgi:hypothetical protein